MLNYSVIQIFRSFSDNELTQFSEFIKDPFLNKNLKVIDLFDLLKPFHPEYRLENLTKEKLFKSMMGNVSYKESYIRNLFSDLNAVAEKFLKINLTDKNPKFEKLFIEDLKDRDLFGLAGKKINSFEKKIKSNKARDHNYYEDINFVYEVKSFLIVDKALTDNFRELQLDNTIKLFLITIMEDVFYLMVEEQRVNVKHRYDFLKHILEYMKGHKAEFEDSPLLMIYYHLCICLLTDSSDEYFIIARKYFRKYFHSLTKIDKKNIYSVMQVYYINKIAGGDKSYNKEFLKFMLDMLKFNVLSHRQGDYINLNLYRNILILCTIEKETNILKKFISTYINYVDICSRESVLVYSDSQLSFLQGNFERALELCSKINLNDLLNSTSDNLYFKNDIKTLTLKSLYELNEFESALSFIDTYKHFLRNTKFIKVEMKNNYLLFANSVNQLIRLNHKFDEYAFTVFKNKISKATFTNTNWVMEKLNSLKQV
ncbi:MAG: hypothetical protein SGI89_04155 [bacterium]|nr:hypothetical protein [bacterium]